MLTAIEIENFKAFGEWQRIELRPLTLLFGPNSGGKSTVIHALHYLREILCEGNLDAHRTWSGGDALDFGGVRNIAHGRHIDYPVVIRAEFTLDGGEIPQYTMPEQQYSKLNDDHSETILGLIKSAEVALEIDVSPTPIVRRIQVGVNGWDFAVFEQRPERRQAEICGINWYNPVLTTADGRRVDSPPPHPRHAERRRTRSRLTRHQRDAKDSQDSLKRLEFERLEDDTREPSVLADYLRSAGVEPTHDLRLPTPLPTGTLPDLETVMSLPMVFSESVAYSRDYANEFTCLLSMLLLGPVAVLRKQLTDLRYVGPLRSMPSRQAATREYSNRSRWPSGLAAWDTIAHGNDHLLSTASDWLEAEDRLDTGYRLERSTFKEVPSAVAEILTDADAAAPIAELRQAIESLPEHTRISLRDIGRNLLLQPQDVGVGLSQIVPVIVALLDPASPLVALEQPELHLHPRQQAALGDLLIAGMRAAPSRVVLVETHSEHLILRLLRRMRETSRGQVTSERELTPSEVRIQYVRRAGSFSTVQVIDADVNGDLVDPWPDDFFEQDFKERFS